jgi:flagellar biosynthetic protein FliR
MKTTLFEFINFGSDQLQLLLLVILRTSGLFILAPIFGDQEVPRTIRAGLLIVLSLVMVSAMPAGTFVAAESLWQLVGLAVRELLVGLAIGLIFKLLFYGVHTAGALIGYQMGFAVVTVYDRNLANQVSVLGQFWYALAILIFLTINGHHLIISALADSYQAIPPGGVGHAAGVGELVIKSSAYLFVIALKIAAPVMITLFLADVALGAISKAMPTMNVFFVGFPIKIAAGLLVMAMSLPIFSYVLEQSTAYLDKQLLVIFKAFGEA